MERRPEGTQLSEAVSSLCKRRGFLLPSFDIYGGVAGLYDYGPAGAALKREVYRVWRDMYVVEEGLLEIDSPILTPEPVFIASGHVGHFTDYHVACTKCDGHFRADHLLEGVEDNPDSFSQEQLVESISKHGIKCPDCKGDLGDVEPFNLMFRTQIGPSAKRVGYMRPETAQGIFVDFQYLYKLGRSKMPMGVCQIGKGFRNEIAPRQGVIRLREFNMGEVEYFVDPEFPTNPGFEHVKDEVAEIVFASGEVFVGQLHELSGRINEHLLYHLGLATRFYRRVGLERPYLRFRQHLPNEMAHYASDCYDSEVRLSYGWIECAGFANRTAYDLTSHMETSGKDQRILRKFDEPRVVTRTMVKPDHKKLGPTFRGQSKAIADALAAGTFTEGDGGLIVTLDGEVILVPSEMYSREEVSEKLTGEKFIPHVIEPSYGIDRIIYAILENSYVELVDEGSIDAVTTDDGEEAETDPVDGSGPESVTRVLRLRPTVAPTKVAVFPLMTKDGLAEKAEGIAESLRSLGITTAYDGSGSIGRRYARQDEVGTPYCVTVDYASMKDGTVTIRDRDSKDQVRIQADRLVDIIPRLIRDGMSFGDI